jgi:uncharacterized membrane protein YciS (DUF1049 family)
LKNFILIVSFMLVLTLSSLFFAQNDFMAEIKFFGESIQWQMNWILISTLTIGFLLGVISLAGSLFTAKVKLANANRRLALHSKEIENLRALPIKNDY